MIFQFFVEMETWCNVKCNDRVQLQISISFIFIARYNTVRVFEKRRRKIKRKEKKKKKVKKYMVQIGNASPVSFCTWWYLYREKKCDACVCKKPNNGTYLSRKWLNERMIVKTSVTLYLHFFREKCRKAHSQTS